MRQLNQSVPVAVNAGATVAITDLRYNEQWAVLYNESPLAITVATGVGQRTLPAWTGDLFQLAGKGAPPFLSLTGITVLTQVSPPASAVIGDIYLDTERPSGIFPLALARQVSIGGTVSTSSTPSIKQDGSAPATSLIEATPSDQAASSWSLNNDASGFLKVLSANVMRAILNVVRGNATTGKAAITLGDSGDTSITTLYATLGAGSVVPPATIEAGALPASVTMSASELTAGTAPAGVDLTTISSDAGKIVSDAAGNLTVSAVNTGLIFSRQSGAENGITLQTWSGTAAVFPLSIAATQNILSIGGRFNSALAYLDNGGSYFGNGADSATGVFVAPNKGGLTGDQGGSLELGASNLVNPGSALTPYIDFHSSANARDFDSRIAASGGSTADGQGTLRLQHKGGNASLMMGSRFTGPGTGTFSHGLGTTPNHVDPVTHLANSTQTMGYDAEGATTVHITTGAGMAWTAFATAI